MSVDPTKKPYPQSKLKNLPEERQWDIRKFAADNSLEKTRDWLAEDGLATSIAALSEFVRWFDARERLRKNEAKVLQLLEHYKEENPDAASAKVEAMGQRFFTALAMEQEDPKAWTMLRIVALKEKQLNLDEKKFQRDTCKLFIQYAQDKRAVEIAGSNMPNDVKTDRLGQLIFGEEWKNE